MILLLSTSDTDLLSARAADGPVGYRLANPSRLALDDLPALLDGADLVVVRLLGGVRAWQDGLDQVLATGRPVVVLTGEQAPDAQLMAASTVPDRHRRRGARLPRARRPRQPGAAGPLPLRHRAAHRPRLRAARARPLLGPAGARRRRADVDGPDRRGALLPRPPHERQHRLRRGAVRRRSRTRAARPLPLYVASLRAPEPELIDALRAADAIVTTVLAAGGTKPAEASAGGDDESWDAGALAGLDVPDPPGALPDRPARRLGGERRGRLPAGRRHARSRCPSSTAA